MRSPCTGFEDMVDSLLTLGAVQHVFKLFDTFFQHVDFVMKAIQACPVGLDLLVVELFLELKVIQACLVGLDLLVVELFRDLTVPFKCRKLLEKFTKQFLRSGKIHFYWFILFFSAKYLLSEFLHVLLHTFLKSVKS